MRVWTLKFCDDVFSTFQSRTYESKVCPKEPTGTADRKGVYSLTVCMVWSSSMTCQDVASLRQQYKDTPYYILAMLSLSSIHLEKYSVARKP